MFLGSRPLLLTVFLLLSLTGCGEKSAQFYAENPVQTAEVLTKCNALGVAQLKDQNCVNAIEGNAMAVRARNEQQAAARKASLKQWRDAADAQMNKK